MKTSLQITLVDVTSVNFNSKKVYEDDIFSRQDILQFFSGEFKELQICQISIDVRNTLKIEFNFDAQFVI